MRKSFAVAIAVLALAGCSDRPGDGLGSGIPADVRCEWARVRHVVDGDTVRVDFEGGETNRSIRYIGIDTPETVASDRPVEPFGPEASKRNGALVSGARVCLERDVSETDRFGRLLRYAWLPDGELVNEVLVREGLATTLTIPPDVKYSDRFVAAQRAARDERLGIWGEQ